MKMMLLVAMIPIAIVLFLVRCEGTPAITQTTPVKTLEESHIDTPSSSIKKADEDIVQVSTPIEKAPVIEKPATEITQAPIKDSTSGAILESPEVKPHTTETTPTQKSDVSTQESTVRDGTRKVQKEKRDAEHIAIAKVREEERAEVQAQREEEAKKRERDRALRIQVDKELALQRAAETKNKDIQNTRLQERKSRDEKRAKEQAQREAQKALAAKEVQTQRDEEAKKREHDRALRIQVAKELALQRAAETKNRDIQKARDEKRAKEQAQREAQKALAAKELQAQREEEAKKRERDRALRIQVAKELALQRAAESAKLLTEKKAIAKEKITLSPQTIVEKNISPLQTELMYKLALTKVKFMHNKAQLTDGSKLILNQTATLINEHPNFHYNIQGHTDSTGDENYNLDLSQQRAQSVKDYLVQQGVEESILSAIGYGSSQPLASNKTKSGRLANRRVVFEIVK